jgi:hypothetical protein
MIKKNFKDIYIIGEKYDFSTMNIGNIVDVDENYTEVDNTSIIAEFIGYEIDDENEEVWFNFKDEEGYFYTFSEYLDYI